jgi:hypothetical protein
VHNSGISSKAPKNTPIPPPFAEKPCDPDRRKQPPAQDREGMNHHVYPVGAAAIAPGAVIGEHRGRIPPART